MIRFFILLVLIIIAVNTCGCVKRVPTCQQLFVDITRKLESGRDSDMLEAMFMAQTECRRTR